MTPGGRRAQTVDMSGPVDLADTSDVAESAGAAPAPTVEVMQGREATVGQITVRRVLPRRLRRSVGAWCFADHMGPTLVDETHTVDIGPHPHLGLHTVTWLIAGELLHRDSLGSEQVIRPGQLNLMTAGHGVAHAEEATGDYRGQLAGVQMWVAQPEETRHGAPAFEHHPELPQVSLGAGEATVLVGAFGDVMSPARADTPLVGVDGVLTAGASRWPLRPDFEYAVVVLDGVVGINDKAIMPGQLGYLGEGREELTLLSTAAARVLLLGGEPFPEPLLMYWNYVARTRAEIDEAARQWNAHDPRFGDVASPLTRIPSPLPPWPSG
jgi:redox-sensitive bicupin YhaK (pirin superfamily)